MVLNIVALISSNDKKDKIPDQVEQGILRCIRQAYVLNTLQLIINTVSYPILGTGLRKDVQWRQSTVPVRIILLKK